MYIKKVPKEDENILIFACLNKFDLSQTKSENEFIFYVSNFAI